MTTSQDSLERRVRWEQIAADITDSITAGQLTPGARLPSETALAAQYGVCRMTAHRALHELKVRGLVDRRRRAGTTVAAVPPVTSPTAWRVAVLTFAADDFPTIDYLRGLRDGLPDGSEIVFCDTGENGELEARYLKQMAQGADAIVCFPSAAAENTGLMQQIVASGQPFVCLDRLPDGLEAPAIVSDNYEASLTVLRRLVARGHHRIAHFTDDRLMVSSTRERYEAYRAVMDEMDGGPAQDLVRLFTSFQEPREQYFDHLSAAVHEALAEMMARSQPPTAVFCLQDAYLAAVLASCARLGIDVPLRLEVVSFNDCPPQFMPLPASVVRIVQQPRVMGRHAGALLSKIIRERVAGSTPAIPAPQRVPAQIVDSRE